jgi:undecaprenyl-diphosphatase
MEGLVQIDQQITLWINNLDCPLLYPFWRLFSHVQIWFPAYLIIVGFLFWRLGWKKGLAVTLSLVLCVVLSDQIANLFKNGVCRLRPCYTPWMLENGILLPAGPVGGDYGFYSGHAANSFGFAMASWLGFRKNDQPHSYKAYGWGVFVWATLVGISRIMMGAHFLGDVLTGAAAGLLMGAGLAFATHWVVVKAKL